MEPIAEPLASALWKYAVDVARGEGFPIADNCRDHLQGFIRTGVARIEEHGPVDAGSEALARANLRRFVLAMAEEARAMGLSELHEPTFFAALPRLCPLWPFC
jgi:hypothetical protein